MHIRERRAVSGEARAARFDVHDQRADAINNVGGDQHNLIQHFLQERESFLREVAAARTRARWLIGTGFLFFAVGFGLFAFSILTFIVDVQELSTEQLGSAFGTPELLGPDVAGVPAGALGFGLALLGTLLLMIGVVLHVVAAARRRRAPQPPPWLAGAAAPPYPFDR